MDRELLIYDSASIHSVIGAITLMQCLFPASASVTRTGYYAFGKVEARQFLQLREPTHFAPYNFVFVCNSLLT